MERQGVFFVLPFLCVPCKSNEPGGVSLLTNPDSQIWILRFYLQSILQYFSNSLPFAVVNGEQIRAGGETAHIQPNSLVGYRLSQQYSS